VTRGKTIAVGALLTGLAALALGGGPRTQPSTRPATTTSPAATQPAKPRTVSERFGFLGPDVYKAHGPAGLVRVADFDSDARNDVLFVNNGKNKIIIYFQESDAKLTKREFDIERYISEIVVGDFNGDSRADLAYLGDPKNLVVVFQEAGRRFGAEKEFKTKGRLLAAGDVNGDARDDLVVASKEAIAVLLQGTDGTFAKPLKMEIEEATIQEIVLADVNGDGRLDLCSTSRTGKQVAYRLQRAGGHFAPAITQRLKNMHGATFGRVGSARTACLLAFHDRTNACKMLTLRSGEARRPAADERFRLSSARQFSCGAGRAKRVLAVGDINGDSRIDLVVADGGTAQLAVYRQGPGGELARRVRYPTLSAVTQVAVDSRTGDIFVLSPTERLLGVARQERSGRVTFPKPLSIEGKPTAMALADFDAVKGQDLLVAVQNEEARTSHLVALYRQADGALGKPTPAHRFTDEDLVVSRLVPVDLDGNALTDLVVFFGYQKPRLLLQGTRGTFEDVSEQAGFRKGLTNALKRTHLGVGDVDGDGRPELLVATKNFARSLTLRGGRLTVLDQYNGRSGESTIVRAETLDLDADGRNEIVLFDSQARELSILTQGEDKAYTIVQDVEVGSFNLRDFLVADLNGDSRPDMVLAADDKFAIVYSGRKDKQFGIVGQYKTLIKDGRYTSVTTGDLDGDGGREILVVEGVKHHVEILSATDAAAGAGPAPLSQELTFRVYEAGPREHAPRWGRRSEQREPRRAIVADITNDGKDDILLLIHDNLVIYRQE